MLVVIHHQKEIQDQELLQHQLIFKLLEEEAEQLQLEHLLVQLQAGLEERELERKFHHHLMVKYVVHIDISQAAVEALELQAVELEEDGIPAVEVEVVYLLERLVH